MAPRFERTLTDGGKKASSSWGSFALHRRRKMVENYFTRNAQEKSLFYRWDCLLKSFKQSVTKAKSIRLSVAVGTLETVHVPAWWLPPAFSRMFFYRLQVSGRRWVKILAHACRATSRSLAQMPDWYFPNGECFCDFSSRVISLTLFVASINAYVLWSTRVILHYPWRLIRNSEKGCFLG